MPIIDLQVRARELGRIRIGQVVVTKNGKTAPAKLDRFRVTSASRPLLDAVAAKYGGTVKAWTPQGGGAQQWEVLTESTRLPILVPPQPVSQFYELWSGGGCVRRCDGQTELISDSPCVCGPDPVDRACKPTTRLNVILKDIPGVGVFRVETKGYYAAVELPQAAHFLAQAGGYVNGFLALEARRIKRDGQTRDFMVPTLEIDITPAELMAGQGAAAMVASPPVTAAIEATTKSTVNWQERDGYVTALSTTEHLADLTALYAEVQKSPYWDTEMYERFAAQRKYIEGLNEARVAWEQAPAREQAEASVDALWMQVVASAPDGWTTTQLTEDFVKFHGNEPADANVEQMQTYLTHTKSGSAA